MLSTDRLDYDLPRELIAAAPSPNRDEARLMVASRARPERTDHRLIRDLPDLLTPGDVLVFNTSRVIPARVRGVKEPSGAKIEGLYLGPAPHTAPGEGVCRILLKSRRFRPGSVARLVSPGGQPTAVTLILLSAEPDEDGARLVRFEDSSVPVPSDRILPMLDRVGTTPLPPYIRAARRQSGSPDEAPADPDRYETVYAAQPGSVAAPTAGLHFTPHLLDRLASVGVERVDVLLHVGPGTFKPVEAQYVEQHPMHAEWCSMSPEAVGRIRQAKAGGRRIIPVGTTSARTLESYAKALQDEPSAVPQAIETNLLITPGTPLRWITGLITNFHLPRSTLMALVAALFPAGTDDLQRLYREAIEHRYRFYSFGDAMLILP